MSDEIPLEVQMFLKRAKKYRDRTRPVLEQLEKRFEEESSRKKKIMKNRRLHKPGSHRSFKRFLRSG